jgi:BlaI family transcriptional regulator, penicillinase repressor
VLDPALPDAELDLMVRLWKEGPQTASALRMLLAASRPMTHASISTLLSRLMRKGLVARRKGNAGKAFVFRAAVEPFPVQRHLIGDLLDRVFAGSGVALVTALLESRRPTARELDELCALVDDLRKRKNRSAPTSAKSDRRKGRAK